VLLSGLTHDTAGEPSGLHGPHSAIAEILHHTIAARAINGGDVVNILNATGARRTGLERNTLRRLGLLVELLEPRVTRLKLPDQIKGAVTLRVEFVPLAADILGKRCACVLRVDLGQASPNICDTRSQFVNGYDVLLLR
jgi:hypothetical protein